MKRARLQRMQDPSQSNVDKLKDMDLADISGTIRGNIWRLKLMNL
jgi:hypothetical protein